MVLKHFSTISAGGFLISCTARVTRTAFKRWGANPGFGVVAGANDISALTHVRRIVGNDVPIMVPRRIGVQGGRAANCHFLLLLSDANPAKAELSLSVVEQSYVLFPALTPSYAAVRQRIEEMYRTCCCCIGIQDRNNHSSIKGLPLWASLFVFFPQSKQKHTPCCACVSVLLFGGGGGN